MQWYYAQNNQQLGPVDEATLRQLVAQGIIRADTLVWREGMGDWQPYGQVATPAVAAGYPVRSLEAVAAPERPVGTGGELSASQLRAAARAALDGKWWPLIGFVFVFWCVQFAVEMVAGFIPLLGAFIPLALTGPFMLGLMSNILRVSRGGESDFNDLWSGFHNFGRAFGIYVLPALMIFVPIFVVGIMVVIVGGAMGFMAGQESFGDPSSASAGFIIALLLLVMIPLCIYAIYIQTRFSFIYFILADHPETGVIDVLKGSWRLTSGRVLKVFWLGLTFIGWGLLAMLTLGLGLLALTPYMMVAYAKLYDDLQAE